MKKIHTHITAGRPSLGREFHEFPSRVVGRPATNMAAKPFGSGRVVVEIRAGHVLESWEGCGTLPRLVRRVNSASETDEVSTLLREQPLQPFQR